MEALLLITGAAFILLSWLWLVLRSLRLGLGKFLLALLFAPLTPLLRGMGYPLWPRLLLVLGMLSLLAGMGLLYQKSPEQLDSLLSGRWAESHVASGNAQGTITGQVFTPERVYWRGHDLVFEEGEAQHVRRSLVIRFANAAELLKASSIERLPSDDGAWPELLLQWYSGALNTPGLRRLGSGYSMSLNFSEPVNGQVQGYIYLQLPANYGTWLTGSFELSSVPDWLQQPDALEEQIVLPEVQTQSTTQPAVSAWQELSLLAVLDEPELFEGDSLRLTTSNGRQHQGVFKQLSADKRLVLVIPYGPHQVELHFQPEDLLLLESLVYQ